LQAWQSCTTLRDVTFSGFSLGGDERPMHPPALLRVLPALQSLDIHVESEITLLGLKHRVCDVLSYLQLEELAQLSGSAPG
jgi:hypothetical protein